MSPTNTSTPHAKPAAPHLAARPVAIAHTHTANDQPLPLRITVIASFLSTGKRAENRERDRDESKVG